MDSSIVSFYISINGNIINSNIQIVQINIENNISKISKATINILEHVNDTDSSSDQVFILGSAVEIGVGYGTSNAALFKGSITKIGIQIEERIGKQLVVTCNTIDMRAPTTLRHIPTPKAVFTYGENILALNMEMASMAQKASKKNDSSSKDVINAVKGELVILGTSLVKPNDIILVNGVSNFVDGNLFVNKVAHVVKDGNWNTTLFVEPNLKF